MKKITIITIALLIGLALLGCGMNVPDEITSDPSINELKSIEIGGIAQWIHIKGDDESKPLLLVLHGGPGFSMMPMIGQMNKALEEEFIVVNWDQRGSGKSYDPNIPIDSMTLDQFVLDANELTNYLRKAFNKDKIYILGHSFGSLMGMKLIEEYPENYCGYFGTGQMIDFISNEQLGYDFALAKAEETDNGEVIEILKSVGRPDSQGNYMLEDGYEETSKYIEYYGGALYEKDSIDPIYDLIFDSAIYENDEQNLLDGYEFSQLIFDDEAVRTINLQEDIRVVEVPVYFLQGRHDYDTPSELVQSYFEILEAPKKELIWFEQSAHFPFYEEADKFSETIIEVVKCK